MTLFAVHKDEHSKTLKEISWPRAQNEFLPDPPKISLPNLGLFSSIVTPQGKKSAIYIDIQNIFHNLALPHQLPLLFPMKKVRLADLPQTLCIEPLSMFNIRRVHSQLSLRPCQATLPMGYKWAVAIAHSLSAPCINQIFAYFRLSRLLPPPHLSPLFLLCEHSSFKHFQKSPLILHIIDDILIVFLEWQQNAVAQFHRILRALLQNSALPVKEENSPSVDWVEFESLNIIGCTRNLKSKEISSISDKMPEPRSLITTLRASSTAASSDWSHVVSRVTWLYLLNCP